MDLLNPADMPSIVEKETGWSGWINLTGPGWVEEICPEYLRTLDVFWAVLCNVSRGGEQESTGLLNLGFRRSQCGFCPGCPTGDEL